MRHMYRINRVGHYPVYKSSYRELQEWCKRNPGEMQSWDQVDPVQELNELSAQLEEAERLIRRKVWRSAPPARR